MNANCFTTTLLIFLLCTDFARALDRKDTSYFCTAEAAGGVSYKADQKKWGGAIFRTNEKFVLRLKFVDVEAGTSTWDKNDIYTNFEVFLTPSGTNSDSRCSYIGAGGKKVSVSKHDQFTCYAALQQYIFNLNTNRYLNIYAQGYTDGTDNNDDTPSVTAGVCTKIN
jgi:hypothetical protein